MWLKSPKFWRKPGALTSRLLTPLSYAYARISQMRYASIHPKKLNRPIICIGNITVGGAGKTPVAIAMQKLLQEKGLQSAFLSRGYGGSMIGPHCVDGNTDIAADVGDEPLLLSQYAPAWVARNRIAGAEAAIKAGADIVIMDDGFQNPSIHKDISLLVIDGNYGTGNGLILPAGPLREMLENALKRVQGVVILGEDIQGIAKYIPSHTPIFFASIQSKGNITLDAGKYFAFAGIGNPEKFFTTLNDLGKDLVSTESFPDHYPYKDKDIIQILDKANVIGAKAITTEKDWVRIPQAMQKRVAYLPIEVKWKDEGKVINLLDQYLGKVT